MRVHVEERRKDGVFIPRYRPQTGWDGNLRMVREEVHHRIVYLLALYPERRQNTVQMKPFMDGDDVQELHRMVLFDPRLTYIDDDRLRFIGYEATKELAWVVQEWDVKVLQPTEVTTRSPRNLT